MRNKKSKTPFLDKWLNSDIQVEQDKSDVYNIQLEHWLRYEYDISDIEH